MPPRWWGNRGVGQGPVVAQDADQSAALTTSRTGTAVHRPGGDVWDSRDRAGEW